MVLTSPAPDSAMLKPLLQGSSATEGTKSDFCVCYFCPDGREFAMALSTRQNNTEITLQIGLAKCNKGFQAAISFVGVMWDTGLFFFVFFGEGGKQCRKKINGMMKRMNDKK